jgi:hypothetical protein
LCVNLADPVPASAARSRGPALAAAPSVLAGHGPPPIAAPGPSAGHGSPPVAHGGDAAPVATPGLLAGHGPQRATRDCGPAVVAGLRWTWVFGFNFPLVIHNTLVSIITSLGHTLWCNLVHTVKIITRIFVSYEMEISKLIN